MQGMDCNHLYGIVATRVTKSNAQDCRPCKSKIYPNGSDKNITVCWRKALGLIPRPAFIR